MKYGFIFELIYKFIAYSFLMIAIWTFVKPLFMPLLKSQYRHYKTYIRVRKLRFIDDDTQVIKKFFIYKHLELLLGSIWPWYSESSVIYFILFTIVLFTLSLIVFMKVFSSWLIILLFSIITGAIPYIILLVLLFWERSETSYDLVPATNILLGKYRVNHKNIYRAIIETAKEMNKYRLLQKNFIRLASVIQSYRNKEDLVNAIDIFVFQIGTSWARQLGIQILNAQLENKNIELPLSNIVKDMGKSQEILEQEKSKNQDTIQMGFIIPIIIFPVSIYMISKVMTLQRYIYFQFKTETGFTSFITTAIFCLVGFIVALVLRKPKNDM